MSDSQPESRKLRPSPVADRGNTLRPEDRVRRRSEYLRVQEQGRRVHTDSFVLLVLPYDGHDGHGPKQLGITVTKRVGSAVVRNRIKRLVREAFRLERNLFPDDCQVVVVARPSAATLNLAAVTAELAAADRSLRKAALAGALPRRAQA